MLLESFDGHGFGLVGPHGTGGGNNPSDNSLAVGPDHVVETVNSRIAIYSSKGAVFDKSGTVLFGPDSTNVIFSGFGGECERSPNGDAVVRYDQLAERWLYVMPLFRRAVTAPGQPQGEYGMCYAVSTGAESAGSVLPLLFRARAFPRLPAARDLAGWLLHPDQHGRQSAAQWRAAGETRLCGRALEDAARANPHVSSA